jgi:hypothetical protein
MGCWADDVQEERGGLMYDFEAAVNGPRQDDLMLIAGENLTAKRFQVVTIENEQVFLLDNTSPADDLDLGILQNAPRAGETAIVRVATGALSFIRVGDDPLAVGDWTICGNSGQSPASQGLARVADGSGVENRVGVCVKAAASGALGVVLMRPTFNPGPVTETDPVVAAINGIVKVHAGVIQAAIAGTDFAQGLHATQHQNGGGDEVAVAIAAANAIPKAGAGSKLDIGWIPTGSTGSTVPFGNDSRLSDARIPTAHATSHKSGGSDAVKLDELSAPTDVATLNASTSAHGLHPKLDNVATHFMDGTGSQRALTDADIPDSITVALAAAVTTNANLTGPITSVGNATAIAAKAVTPAKMDDVATASVFYRKTAGTGAPEVQALATLKTDLGLTGTNSGDQTETDPVVKAINGLVKSNGSTIAAAVAGTDYVAPASAETLTNKTIDAEGAGNVITYPVKTWYPAGAASGAVRPMWSTPASTAATIASAGTNIPRATAQYPDNATAYAFFEIALPSDWVGAIDISILWYAATTAGDVVWQVATAGAGDNTDFDPTFNTAQNIITTSKSVANRINTSSLTGLTLTGLVAGGLAWIKILRDPAHASDTLGATANIIGAMVTLRRAM